MLCFHNVILFFFSSLLLRLPSPSADWEGSLFYHIAKITAPMANATTLVPMRLVFAALAVTMAAAAAVVVLAVAVAAVVVAAASKA